MGLWSRKVVEQFRGAYRALLVGRWKTVVLRAMQMTTSQHKRFRRGRIILVSGPKTALIIFWQRIWLLSGLVQKNLPEAKLRSFGLMAFGRGNFNTA